MSKLLFPARLAAEKATRNRFNSLGPIRKR